jgi:hypothetical protein
MKLALIAMSGLRAYNEELTRLGLTLPGFVERSKTIASLPSLGLLTLAGMTPADVEMGYFEIENLAGFDGLPDDYDAVAISRPVCGSFSVACMLLHGQTRPCNMRTA